MQFNIPNVNHKFKKGIAKQMHFYIPNVSQKFAQQIS